MTEYSVDIVQRVRFFSEPRLLNECRISERFSFDLISG